jgi:alanine racemase
LNHWVEVSGEHLRRNFAALRDVAGPEVELLGVIKANAYGHGVGVVAPVLRSAGARWLGVTDAEEGALVRAALGSGARPGGGAPLPEILVMSGLVADEAAVMVEHALTATVWCAEQVAWLEAAAGAAGRRVDVHVEIDTGMSRQGAQVGAELAQVLRAIGLSERVRMTGVLTHFAQAEVSRSRQTVEQQALFEDALRQVSVAGLRPEWVHAGNSSLVDEDLLVDWLRRQASGIGARAMVRPGIALYGYCLPMEDGVSHVRGALQPVMTWKAKVIGLREVEAGTRVGYGGAFVTPRAMRLALLPVGYADGLRRELSSTAEAVGGWAMIGGRRAAIVGRVSMNLTVVDVTGIDGVALGDEAVVLGKGVTAEDHAALAGTLAYEILCGVRGEIVLVD